MKKRTAFGVAIVVILALALGALGGYLAAQSTTNQSTTAQVTQLSDGKPHIVSASTLTHLAPIIGIAYWAGERPDSKIALTVTESTIYVRYLRPTAAADSAKPTLTVATYRNIDGFGSLTAQSTASHAQSGAVIAVKATDPLSTYFAFPSSTFEVEVYSPMSGESTKLVNNGSVTPITAR
ncbi:hypothetical protein ACPPVW_02150 [Leifsonia sp. McL0607]|uniref:hypothetical protein n=1 Tax=Leifsonia sp. McL0607 TaxID=3415672 RepID=UPI003CFA92D1